MYEELCFITLSVILYDEVDYEALRKPTRCIYLQLRSCFREGQIYIIIQKCINRIKISGKSYENFCEHVLADYKAGTSC